MTATDLWTADGDLASGEEKGDALSAADLKRSIGDALASMALLGLTMPLMLLFALLVKITPDGDVALVGEEYRGRKLLKFRYKSKDNPEFVSDSDILDVSNYDELVDDTANSLINSLAFLSEIPKRRVPAFRKAIRKAIAEFAPAGRETTGHATADCSTLEVTQPEPEPRTTSKPRPPEGPTAGAKAKARQDRILARKLSQLEAKAVEIGDGTLLGLIARYKMERGITLPRDGVPIKDPEQAKAAARLPATFTNLQDRLKLRRLEPLPPDELALKAKRQSVAFYRHRKAAVEPA